MLALVGALIIEQEKPACAPRTSEASERHFYHQNASVLVNNQKSLTSGHSAGFCGERFARSANPEPEKSACEASYPMTGYKG